jgi:hypothetical protein
LHNPPNWLDHCGESHAHPKREVLFGPRINLARAEPVAVAKHGRPVVVLAIEEYERLKALETPTKSPAKECMSRDGVGNG